MNTEIYVNKSVQDTETGNVYLILWISPGNEYGYWYDLNSSSRKPLPFQFCNIQNGLQSGRYEEGLCPSPQIIRSEDTLTSKELRHRDRIWGIMKNAVETEPDIYDNKLRHAILREAADRNSIATPNLYVWLDSYWRSGKTKNAFLPKYSNCGSKGKERHLYRRKSNINSDNTTLYGKTLDDNDRLNFASAVKLYYLTKEKMSLRTVYEKLLQDFYAVPISDDGHTSKLKLLPPQELPTFRQFQYWYSKNRNIIIEAQKRDGESKFELNKRSILGKADHGLMGPGAQYQIDATVGDIYLVSQFDRSNIIGRPVIYFVIDAFSRMVTGMSVGLEGPSWTGAMMALENMTADKVLFCREYGIEIKESDWPCHHVPSSILGDRGEMESKNADNLVNILGIRIVNAPPYRADLKGIIEQHFRTINTNSVALLPGSVKPDMSKRGGKDYRFDATLDIRQLIQIIIKCVLYYNNHHYMGYFEKNEYMQSDNVESIPCRIWEWGIQNCSGALRSYPQEQVRMAVMPTANATVTAKGIRFKGVYYSSDRAIREAWFEKARSGKTWQVIVSYDPRDMENIYICNQDSRDYDSCFLLEWNWKYAGKYLDEVIYEQRKEKLVQKQLKLSETEAKINLNAEIETIVSEAKRLAGGLPEKSKTSRVSQIRDNRKHERERMQLESSTYQDAPECVNNQIPSTQSESKVEELSPTLQMIKRKVEERLKNE